MRYLLPLIALLMLIRYAGAQLCPDTPAGYTRQYRPEGTPANYPPPTEPACYMQSTQASAIIPSCTLCHPHKFEPWRG